MDEALRLLTEHDDRWILPYQGLLVTQVQVDLAFGLDLNDNGAVRISTPATPGWPPLA